MFLGLHDRRRSGRSALGSGAAAVELFAGSAVLTAVLGFAFRDTPGNVVAGLAIHAEHPFEVDDWIQYELTFAHIGKIIEINWRATKVITLDLAFVIIPNSQLPQAPIRNFTKPGLWSCRSFFVVALYEVPSQKGQSIMLDAVRGSCGVLDNPVPSVVTNDYTERGIEYWVRILQPSLVIGIQLMAWLVIVFYALARNGIRSPVSTHQVRMTQLPIHVGEPQEAIIAERARRLRSVGVLGMLSLE